MQVVQSGQQAGQVTPRQPEPIPPRQYGLVTLHDGRQVDSGSEEWRLECLARTLLQLGGAEQYEWISGYGTADDQRALRMRMSAIKASANAGLKER
jgi:hypothetical protein